MQADGQRNNRGSRKRRKSGPPEKQESGSSAAEVCRKHFIRYATFYKYKVRFGSLDVWKAQRMSC